MNNPQIPETCPDCSSLETKVISGVGKAFRQPDEEGGFLQPVYRIWKCESCFLHFRTPSLTDGELGDYYASLPPNHWEYTAFNPPERRIQKAIRDLPEKSRVLDFGCSSGRLLAPWVSSHDCYGFEINAAAAATAESRGLKLLSNDELWTMSGSFDLIVLVDVFEHLRTPSKLLTNLWRLLAPNGRLIVSTGNGNHWACRIDPSQFWYFRNLEHLCMTSPAHMKGLAARWNVAKITIQKCSHYDVPIFRKLVIHVAHSVFWMLHYAPRSTRQIAGRISGVKKVIRWDNAPNLGCASDHLIATFEK